MKLDAFALIVRMPSLRTWTPRRWSQTRSATGINRPRPKRKAITGHPAPDELPPDDFTPREMIRSAIPAADNRTIQLCDRNVHSSALVPPAVTSPRLESFTLPVSTLRVSHLTARRRPTLDMGTRASEAAASIATRSERKTSEWRTCLDSEAAAVFWSATRPDDSRSPTPCRLVSTCRRQGCLGSTVTTDDGTSTPNRTP